MYLCGFEFPFAKGALVPKTGLDDVDVHVPTEGHIAGKLFVTNVADCVLGRRFPSYRRFGVRIMSQLVLFQVCGLNIKKGCVWMRPGVTKTDFVYPSVGPFVLSVVCNTLVD